MGGGTTVRAEPALLEREPQLAALHGARRAVLDGGAGALVVLAGEAGSGKTALLRRFRDECGGVLWGGCDPLFTPRPLGPFADVADQAGGEFAALLSRGAKSHEVAAAVMDEARARRGTVVVCEDLHWADEATLDVLSLLGRRVESVPLLLVLTYRDDELIRHHPLRTLLGELRPALRLRTESLSPAAVATLAGPSELDAVELHRVTGGNPFFVSEVVAAGGGPIPATVREAVLARIARLGEAAGQVLDAVSVAVPYAELELLDALAPADGLDDCLAAGILQVLPAGVGFRHELARRAVEESLGPHRRRDLHRRALAALAALAALSGGTDLARLAHHADAARDPAAVLRYAPAAAVQAASTGAHREAAEQYARALRYADDLPADERAALLEARSFECYLTEQMDAAIELLEQAVELRRPAGDPRRTAVTLVHLSRRLWCAARAAESARVDDEAARLLESLPPGPELALVYSNISSMALNDERHDETVDWGKRALDLAEQLDDTEVAVHSLNNLGTIELLAGRPEGLPALERSLELAEDAGLEEHIGRAYIHLGWAANRTRAYGLLPLLERGIGRCEELGLETWRLYLVAQRARADLDLGRWDAAADSAGTVLRSARSVPLLGILTLCVVGLVDARRGEPTAGPLLDDAAALLTSQYEPQYIGPVAAARAEAAWLDGRPADVDEATREPLELAIERDAGWIVGELAWLRRLAGLPASADGALGPYSAQLAGDVREAAARWTALGCAYDAALALAGSTDEDDLRRALTEFQRLGARPAAAVVARRLRERGVRGLPRGPMPGTRANPAGLTARESEVLELLRSGASNAEIAARLFLSERTVHHHVGAVLRKLGVDSRGRAASEAARRGLG
jgi:DNA-binding CsgD family transcriptional regulator/tetratricopeptide (TPR) repeat protein